MPPALVLQSLRALGHQHWLPFGVRDRIIRRVVNPSPGLPSTFEVSFFGQRYRGALNNFIDWSVYFYGVYGRGEMLFLGDLCRRLGPDLSIIDVGANVGHHTLFFAGLARQVHAFEPWAPVRDHLAARVAENRLNHVRIHPVALGAEDAQLPFYAPETANVGTGSFVASHSPDNRAGDTLEVRQGDRYFAEHGITRADLIKIDVEGFEVNVLRGLADFIARQRPMVFMEYSAATAEQAGASGLLQLLPPRYSLHHLHPTRAGYQLGPFEPACLTKNLIAVPSEREHLLPLRRDDDLSPGGVLRSLQDARAVFSEG